MEKRVIKFRAWEVNKQLGGRMSEPFTVFDIHNRTTGLGTYGDEYTLLQFTGLKDKNGVEIYEGDILFHEMDDCRQVVFYNEGTAAFKRKYDNTGITGALDFMSATYKFCEVIGNIFQNPELLTNQS